MYPAAALTQLAAEKAALRQRIQARRQECVIAAQALARPLAWLDRALALGRQFAPLLRLALGTAGVAWAWFRHRSPPEPAKRTWGPWILTALQLLARWAGNRSP